MPAPTFTVRFVLPIDGMSIGRTRDFGEELASKMREQSLGEVSNPDTAIDRLSISISSRRHAGTVRMLIRKTLAKHRLGADAVVTDL